MKIVLVLAASFALGASSAVAAAPPAVWAVKGLRARAEIIVDRWGIPHLYAASPRDAFFVQGYNAARDRLWQIDLWRKRGLGRLSASFGPAYVDQDRAARLFLYRGDMEQEWAAYAPGARGAVEAFTEGINAYVDEVLTGEKPLPIEFSLTGSRPERWSLEDVVRIRSHALVSNVTSEVARAQVACAAGVDADRLRVVIAPPHRLQIPDGLNPCDVPADVLKDYLLGTEAVSFSALVGPRPRAEVEDAPGRLAARIQATDAEGSNNWAISPSRTASGRPILANDPHRSIGAPSLRYIAHLEAPGLSIIGAGEPALPGISLGHNADVAFGLTIFPIDQEDLYVYDLVGDAYRYAGALEPMTRVQETIEVKGEAPRTVELRFTRHGPVLKIDRTRNKAFALRTVWNEPGASGYFQSSRFWGAKSWTDFLEGRSHWGAPPLNLVYADRFGTIGWAAAGLTPERPNWDGLWPVPGDGRYEWAGFRPASELPSLRNPTAGFVATANAMNLPQGYPDEERKISFEWSDPSRITRIEEVLRAEPKATLEGSMALQTDVVSTQSRRLIRLLAAIDPATRLEGNLARGVALLLGWDSAETDASAAAALYEIWINGALGRAVVDAAAPAARPALSRPQVQASITYLETMAAPAVRDRILLTSLAAAIAEGERRLGPDMGAWRWGTLHHALLRPAIAVVADPATAKSLTLGPREVPGSASTPRATTYNSADFQQTAGASVRMVIDVGAWDNSRVVNTPGESGELGDSHYGDLFDAWAEGRYVPLRYSRTAVERDQDRRIDLVPDDRVVAPRR